MYSGYGGQTDYFDTGERQSKTARTDWDAPGATTQYSHGYQDSGYTRSSTRYPEFLTDPVKHSHKADYSSWDSTHDGLQDRRSTRNLASYHGFSSVENVPKSEYSSNLQGYAADASFRWGDGFSQQNQAFSSHGAAFVKPSFDQTGNSRLRIDANSSRTNRSVQSNHPADSQGGFTFGDRYEEEDSRIGRGFGSQHGRFEKITSANFEPTRTLETSWNRSQKQNSYQNQSSNWKTDDTRHRNRSSTSGSFWHGHTRQGHRSVLAQGRDEPNFETDLAIRMAPEIHQRKQGKVDVNKILKAMNIVDQMSESEEANINQGFVGGGSRGITDKPGFNVSQDFLRMRGSSGRQERSSSRGGRMNMLKQGFNMGLTGQGPRMRMMGEGAIMWENFGIDMMGEDERMAMMDEDGGMDRMGFGSRRSIAGQIVGMDMMGENERMVMDEDGGMGRMGLGSRRNMSRQIVGRDMTGRESRKRTRSSERTSVENRRFRRRNKKMHSVSRKDFYDPPPEKRKLKSLRDMDGRVTDKIMKNDICSFAEFLKKTKLTGGAIKDIEDAVKKSKLGLKVDFEVEPVGEVLNMKSGRLFISGVFIARTAGVNKKQVKRECYEKALHLLTTQSAEVIVKQKDTKKDEIVKEKVEELEKIAKEKQEKEEEEMEENDLEFRNKLRTFSQHMKSIKMDDEDDVDNDEDSVAVLSDAITQFGLDYSYSYRETESARGTHWFIGNLKIGDIQVGVGSGPSRKYAKRSTFTRAMLFLRKKPFLKIMQGMIETEACIIPEFELLDVRSLPNNSSSKKLSKMIKHVLEIPEQTPLKKGIEEAAMKSNLVISLLYKCGHPCTMPRIGITQCDLFIDEIFISSGESIKRAKAESKAYQEAFTVLCSSSADVIFNDFKRMSQEDTKDLMEMLAVGRKERRRIMYSSNKNRMTQKKKKFNILIPEEEESSEDIMDKDEIIIVENKKYSNDDRYLKAYNILQTSALRNFMILDRKISEFEERCCCKLFLQHVKVGESSAPKITEASNQAAAKALFKLYQSRPTIRIAEHDEKNTFSYETMKAKADALKEECGDTGDDDYIYIASDAGSKQKSEDKDDDQMELEDEDEEEHDEAATSTLPVNKWLKQIIEEMIKKFASEESLEEITFCGEFPVGDRLQIQLTADKYNINTRSGTRNGLEHIDVYQRHLPAKIREILQNNDGHSGVYSITPKDELPKPSDFEAFRSLQKTIRTNSKSKKKLSAAQHSPKQSGGVKRQHQQM